MLASIVLLCSLNPTLSWDEASNCCCSYRFNSGQVKQSGICGVHFPPSKYIEFHLPKGKTSHSPLPEEDGAAEEMTRWSDLPGFVTVKTLNTGQWILWCCLPLALYLPYTDLSLTLASCLNIRLQIWSCFSPTAYHLAISLFHSLFSPHSSSLCVFCFLTLSLPCLLAILTLLQHCSINYYLGHWIFVFLWLHKLFPILHVADLCSIHMGDFLFVTSSSNMELI